MLLLYKQLLQYNEDTFTHIQASFAHAPIAISFLNQFPVLSTFSTHSHILKLSYTFLHLVHFLILSQFLAFSVRFKRTLTLTHTFSTFNTLFHTFSALSLFSILSNF